MPQINILRLLKVIILLALGFFLYTRFSSGTILFYINERFTTLTVLASVGLLLIASSYWHHSDDGHHHGHDHDHHHEQLTWIGLLIVTIPVVLGFLVQPKPLGASALGNREISIGTLSSVAAPSGNETMGLIAGERNIIDWLSAFQRNNDPAIFAGEEAHIVGFVYRDERFDEDMFMVGRFVLSCCVADASPVGLIVQWPDTVELADDQWVDVTGSFEVGTFNEIEMPILVAEEITLTEPPAQPYLYR